MFGVEDGGTALDYITTGLDLASRTLFLGDIGEGIADDFVRKMHLLSGDGDEPIHIQMNSKGGIWPDACAIFDCIRAAGVPVSIEVLGSCMSAAVAVAQAAGKRFVHPNATIMVHDGSHGFEGEAKAFETWAEYSKLERDKYYNMLSRHSRKKSTFWRRKCADGDFVMSALKAVELGLFDGIVSPD